MTANSKHEGTTRIVDTDGTYETQSEQFDGDLTIDISDGVAAHEAPMEVQNVGQADSPAGGS